MADPPAPPERPDPADAAARRAALAGDADAWAGLVARHYDAVAAAVRWRCGGCRDLADDSLQETWMEAARQLHRFDPARGGFTAWVRGVARNVVRNQLRARRRRQARHRPLPDDAAQPCPPDGFAVAEALAALSEPHEAVLQAKYLDNQSVREIAADWGATEKGIESLLTRARQAFRAAYRAEERR
jgi:RNA polymerase sigma-70 factor (ECF subfamily)